MRKKTAVIFCTYDGIVSQYCGVGTISKSFIRSLLSIKKELNSNCKFHLHIVSPLLNSTCLGYDEELFEESKDIIRQLGGEIHFISNGSNGFEQYGRNDNRKLLTVGTSGKVLELAQQYDRLICIYTDTPFLQVPYYVNIQHYSDVSIEHYLYMHSDAFIHEKDSVNIERLSWDVGAVSYMNFVDNVYVIDTNPFFTQNLLKNYQFPREKLIPLNNGIDILDSKYSLLDHTDLKKRLESYGIPLNKKIIFSYGRAVPYKGFEQAISAYSKIESEDTHFVLIAAPYVENGGNVSHLKKLFLEYGVQNYTAIYNVDFILPSLLCQWYNTMVVLQLSLSEPFGLIPEEVRMLSRYTGPVCICSNVDGFVDQIEHMVDGFLVDPLNEVEIVGYLSYVLAMDDSDLQEMRKKGYMKMIEKFNFKKNIETFLKRIKLLYFLGY